MLPKARGTTTTDNRSTANLVIANYKDMPVRAGVEVCTQGIHKESACQASHWSIGDDADIS